MRSLLYGRRFCDGCVCYADGLFAHERVMALAEHRQILNLPSTWQQVVQWLDGPRTVNVHVQVSEPESLCDWVLM